MGERGFPPKPTALRELNGNASRRPLPQGEPRYSTDVQPPTWLAGEALEEWERLAPAMTSQGLLTIADVATFSAYCCAWQAFRKAAIELASADRVTDVEQGSATPIGELRKAAELLHKLAKEFGFTPSARTRVTVQAIKGASQLADLEEKLFG